MNALLSLPNVGKVLQQTLMRVGIETPEQLMEIGAKQAFLLIRARCDPTACLHMLYGLEGAVRGVPDKLLDEDTKQDLRAFFRAL